ncbi:MAG TPA: HAD family hydrolase [Thermoanaerobaculia bacterium]|nr:HAD family hydrolase [Thermoanaerobaculia bacterium]
MPPQPEAPSPESPLRLAVWSGPRNISTALMRSFGNRADTWVCDEPFYAYYLLRTRLDHPGRDEVIAAHETDWEKVVDFLTGPVPGGKPVFYQKHMAHHYLPELGEAWFPLLTHAFLIRDPREMLLSLSKKLEAPRLEDTGLAVQVKIFEQARSETGRVPPVVDSRDLLLDPSGVLRLFCETVGLVFDQTMLSWPPQRRPTDGIWAKYWYDAVEASTGWEPYRPAHGELPPHLEEVQALCRPFYEQLHAHRLHL